MGSINEGKFVCVCVFDAGVCHHRGPADPGPAEGGGDSTLR